MSGLFRESSIEAGTFWLGDAPERRVTGQLHFDDCRVELEGWLVSPWITKEDNPNVGYPREDDVETRYRIHGLLASGQMVTLPMAQRYFSLDRTQRFDDLRLFFGWGDGDPDVAAVTHMTLTWPPALAHWLRQSAGDTLDVAQVEAPNLSMRIDAEGRVVLAGVPNWNIRVCEAKLQAPLAALFALLVRRFTSPTSIDYALDGTRVEVTRRTSEQRKIKPIYESVSRLPSNEPAGWLSGWLALSNKLAPSYLVATRAMFDQTTVQSKILTLSSAMERLHDELLADLEGPMPKAERREISERAAQAVPDGYQDRVRSLLNNFLAQPSLAKRLNAVISTLPPAWADDLVGPGEPMGRRWVNEVRDVRNLAAHAHGTSVTAAESDAYVAKLASLSETFGFMATSVLLLQAGFPADRLERGLKGLSHYRLMVNRQHLRWPEIYGETKEG